MVTFVFPMAGKSSRFAAAGYTVPKYMLKIHDVLIFDAVLNGFRAYFKSAAFLFVTQSEQPEVGEFVLARCRALGLSVDRVNIINLNVPTAGQAETVFLGLERLKIMPDNALTIFNIDTIRRDFIFPEFIYKLDTAGYLEVFNGSGDHWSFVEIDKRNLAQRVTEKLRISELCSTGLYYFRSVGDFLGAYRASESTAVENLQGGERYVAPLYNHLIKQRLPIRVHQITQDQVTFCGTPAEYLDVLSRWSRPELKRWTDL